MRRLKYVLQSAIAALSWRDHAGAVLGSRNIQYIS